MDKSYLKAFEQPDEVREFPLGRFEIVHLNGVSLGRATYQPGWKWSAHNAPIAGTSLCHVPHTGVVLSGHGAVQYEDGELLDLLPGTAFEGDVPKFVELRLSEVARSDVMQPSMPEQRAFRRCDPDGRSVRCAGPATACEP